MDGAFRALIPPTSLCVSPPGMSMKPGPLVDSPNTTPHTRGLSNLSAPPQTRGPMQGPPSLPPQPVMQALPPRVPPTLPSHAPQLGAPYSMAPMDCIPQAHVMPLLPAPTHTTLPPLAIQSSAPMLQNTLPPMIKVSRAYRGGKYLGHGVGGGTK